MKKATVVGCIVLVAGTSFIAGRASKQSTSKNCYTENYSWCISGVDIESINEDLQLAIDTLCHKYTIEFCSDEISPEKYKELVETLQNK